MRKAADLIKKQIVQVDTGNIVGNVADLLLDLDAGRLAAVVTMAGRWRETTLIAWEQILVSTGDVILVKPGIEPQAASATPHFQVLLERNIHLHGTPVLTDKGEKIGSLGEMLIDDAGHIQAYTVNRGFLGSERHFVPTSGIISVGADAILIHEGSVRDSLEPLVEAERADEIKHSIVMPLTGARLTVGNEAAGHTPDQAAMPPVISTTSSETDLPPDFAPLVPEAPTLAAKSAPHHIASGPTLHLNAAEERSLQRDDHPTPSAATPHDSAPLPESAPRPIASGPTLHLKEADIDAILRGDQPMPDAPIAPESADTTR